MDIPLIPFFDTIKKKLENINNFAEQSFLVMSNWIQTRFHNQKDLGLI